MRYRSVTSLDTLRKANSEIFSQLRSASAKKFGAQRIVFRPSHTIADVHWLPKQKIWFAAKSEGDHYWLPIGITEPTGNTPLRILFEMNTPKHADHGRAGLILEDETGTLFLAHTGRVGGGVSGINRTEFLKYRGPLRNDTVVYDNSKLAILLGAVSDHHLPDHVGRFALEVSKFKSQPRGQKSKEIRISKEKPFRPKFSGSTRRKAQSEQQIELLHDIVCDVLNAQVTPPGGYSDRERDLFLKKPDGSTSVLYEVKTNCNTTSIYTAVGQLLINGRADGSEPRLVLVVPGQPSQKTRQALSGLGISILNYKWRGDKPIFPDDCLSAD